jgi:mRNA-degrading endonuclease toxin of MazEF toxin-antitoxin module
VPTFPRRFPRRGEIYWVPLDKKRPAVVVSADIGNQYTNAVVVAAMTTTIAAKRFPVNVLLPAGQPLEKEGEVLCRNLYAMPKDELGGYRADLTSEQMDKVDAALRRALAL